MKKNFIKSLSVAVVGLTLAASCSMIEGKKGHKCHSNKCSSEKSDKSKKCSKKCSSKKSEKANKCASNKCSSKK